MIGKDLASVVGSVDKTIDATGKLVIPGGVDPHAHMDLPFGGTSSSTISRRARAQPLSAGRRRHRFRRAVQRAGAESGLDAWFAKAEGKATTDYGFHLIVTDMPDERLPELKTMIDQGVTSFKLFMAYPGSSWWTTA